MYICFFEMSINVYNFDIMISSTGLDDMKSKPNDCFSDVPCPSNCSCEGTIVDCSGRLLTEIPKDIPIYTTEL